MKRTCRISLIICATAAIAGATSMTMAAGLLKAQSFPKTANDTSFIEKMQNLADGYADFEEEYDANGVCVRGCVYPGITLAAADQLSAVATEQAMAAIAQWEQENPDGYNYEDTDADTTESIATQTNNPEFPPVVQQSAPQAQPPRQHAQSVTPPAGYGCPSGRYSRYVKRDAGLPMYPPLNPPLVVSSDYGKRTPPCRGCSGNHPSIDLSVPVGNPVYATAAGTVVQVQNLEKGYGSNIMIQHDTGRIVEFTQYSHLQRGSISVKVGDHIAAGCEIAKSGNTGSSTGPHLDYKIMGANKGRIDPVWEKNRLGYDYKFTGTTSPEHQGKTLPGRK